MTALTNRYDIVYLFDVTRGNPNGDPDAGNLPRLDPETNHGLVSDVSLKRKIRNYTELAKGDQPGYRIYVQEGAILNEKHREAYKAVRGDTDKVARDARLNPQGDEEARALTKFMCDNFFDVRTFGAVMSTGINAGQVRGPVQVSFASSVEPILPLEISITRMAATSEKEKSDRDKGNDGDERTENRTMGRKHIVPYGLYRAHIFVNAKLAERTGFGQDDLDHLFKSLSMMFEHDRSAARGEMAARRGIAFKHASSLGNAHAHALFDRVKIQRKVDDDLFEIGSDRLGNYLPARRFSDYHVTVDRDGLPDQVEIVELF
ncbi:type I-C CRISPR-associated protein Cas7/Csd2 [Bradyrhizobium sp. U87765 SZCCT0131]|uniref:type I-C CRISPR-associated protein Cas7/Csd2 n=1 Tax=unclassified Bradyrhizobium TaxID=2631580 RepID=UPI001BAE1994|nr:MULTISPECIES: type I-C CRISPR-associated protein Cas7/Csd2 [unclassified Bradyrhizobium]MBR1217948.1 type I-C CRISPR-associated protein Cas7/Csd2 [Bradyrhizobium sp. U87765 SZCCT0131]MBR1261106.1 type I-C CRISPR-associated protein Cas7/Csd2 [Bradyrhizobium sp. U87765 SZCCT0134]MBR1303446.1 type I-C CRISPR-associated protein Cas7/Csd2 [Bradyrhizobium sp. U87765 SZCCT0110]MBR1319052.1 type I-C CRISPR-associated protein Cas7/Csd2 [Bradyrhizobium sp. U87765 SZCCT0109]MBR1347377.1 type I-C CRISP